MINPFLLAFLIFYPQLAFALILAGVPLLVAFQ